MEQKIKLSREQIREIAQVLYDNGINQVFNIFNIVGDPLELQEISGIKVYLCTRYGYADIPSINLESALAIEEELYQLLFKDL